MTPLVLAVAPLAPAFPVLVAAVESAAAAPGVIQFAGAFCGALSADAWFGRKRTARQIETHESRFHGARPRRRGR